MGILTIVVSSAVVGAVVSSLVNGVFNLVIKNRELKLQEITLAVKLAELKHQIRSSEIGVVWATAKATKNAAMADAEERLPGSLPSRGPAPLAAVTCGTKMVRPRSRC
jgi:hypothetical protein